MVPTASAVTSVATAKGSDIFRLKKALGDGAAFVYDLQMLL
jgi:hypothetical protein